MNRSCFPNLCHFHFRINRHHAARSGNSPNGKPECELTSLSPWLPYHRSGALPQIKLVFSSCYHQSFGTSAFTPTIRVPLQNRGKLLRSALRFFVLLGGEPLATISSLLDLIIVVSEPQIPWASVTAIHAGNSIYHFSVFVSHGSECPQMNIYKLLSTFLARQRRTTSSVLKLDHLPLHFLPS